MATSITNTYCVHLGNGTHFVFFPVANGPKIIVWGGATYTLTAIGQMASKTSFALTLLRLVKGRTKIVLWVIIGMVNLFLGLQGIFVWIRCLPIRRLYDSTVTSGYCWDFSVYPNYSMFSSIFVTVMDFALALLPWKILWNLQMNKRDKYGLAVAMSLGAFTVITSIMKTVELPTLDQEDNTFRTYNLIIWTSAEIATTIMATSVPALRVLFKNTMNSSKRRDYATMGSSGIGKNNDSTGLARSQNHMASVMGGGDLREFRESEGNSSEEIILQDMKGKIMQHKEISIEYDGVSTFGRGASTDRQVHEGGYAV